MTELSTKQRLKTLRDFLVPARGKSKLVKDLDHMAETKTGRAVNFDSPRAVRFCVVGAWWHLGFKEYKFPLLPIIQLGYEPNSRLGQRTAKETRDMLNKLIEMEK